MFLYILMNCIDELTLCSYIFAKCVFLMICRENSDIILCVIRIYRLCCIICGFSLFSVSWLLSFGCQYHYK